MYAHMRTTCAVTVVIHRQLPQRATSANHAPCKAQVIMDRASTHSAIAYHSYGAARPQLKQQCVEDYTEARLPRASWYETWNAKDGLRAAMSAQMCPRPLQVSFPFASTGCTNASPTAQRCVLQQQLRPTPGKSEVASPANQKGGVGQRVF